MESILGVGHIYDVRPISVENMHPGKRVYLKWRKSMTKTGESKEMIVPENGTLDLREAMAPIKFSTNLRRAASGTAGFKRKPLTFWLQEKTDEPKPMIGGVPKKALAKCDVDLGHYANSNSVEITQEMEVRTTDLQTSFLQGKTPILKLTISGEKGTL